MEKGAAARTTGATKLNEISSRSHAIFMLIVEKSTVIGVSEVQPDGMEDFQGMAPGVPASQVLHRWWLPGRLIRSTTTRESTQHTSWVPLLLKKTHKYLKSSQLGQANP